MNATSVQEHYDRHLGSVYAWMVGGMESAIARGSAEIANLGPTSSPGGVAVDLGAGFGMHALPLARHGYRVLAIGTCATLLDTLRAQREALPIEIIQADLLSFQRYLSGKPELVLCLGDTITHLADEAAVEELIGRVADELDSGGRFVITLRDYSTPLTGSQRFIPVRSDGTRIFTCFRVPDIRTRKHPALNPYLSFGCNRPTRL